MGYPVKESVNTEVIRKKGNNAGITERMHNCIASIAPLNAVLLSIIRTKSPENAAIPVQIFCFRMLAHPRRFYARISGRIHMLFQEVVP